MNQDEITAAVKAERHHLCDVLEDLDDAEWATQSLCSARNVREVVAHLTIPRASVGFVAKAAIKARGSFDRMVADTARDRGEVAQLPNSFSSCARAPSRPDGFPAAGHPGREPGLVPRGRGDRKFPRARWTAQRRHRLAGPSCRARKTV